jgi:hypothetical protein
MGRGQISGAAPEYPARSTSAVETARAAAISAAAISARRAGTPVSTDPVSIAQGAARAAAISAAAISAATRAARSADDFWSAIATDATYVDRGETASALAVRPLWPLDQPEELGSWWREMSEKLLAANQNWDVWTIWYQDRLSGHLQSDERELVYVRIENELWDKGPAVVNAEIRKQIDELEPPPPLHGMLAVVEEPAAAAMEGAIEELTPHAAIENVPSAVSFGWSSKGTIGVVSGALNWPVFAIRGGEQDHTDRLDACRRLAADIAGSLRRSRWNARAEYAEVLDEYVAYLPEQPDEGNFLLADAEARIIRAMFAADTDSLPVGLAAMLQVLLEQHIGLRAYYPQTESFYQSVRTGHLERPLPIEAVEGFIQVVRDHTPSRFEPNVASTLEDTTQPVPAIASTHTEAPKSGVPHPAPPPDPIGEVDPEKTREFTAASGVNALWKVMTSGKKADETIEGWKKVIETLGPYALPILGWLRHFVRL